MKINVTELIDTLEQQANLYGASDASEHQTEALRLQLTANCLRRYRDTLIQIARCQGGVPSFRAQDALKEMGHCSHAKSVYHYRSEQDVDSKWKCHNCEKESDERLVPFE